MYQPAGRARIGVETGSVAAELSKSGFPPLTGYHS
jgi:hypothetical protein